jgi:lactobin A/cerein 7B family class IIb bacteriocin
MENLSDLSKEDLKSVQGGWLPLALAIAGAAIYVYNEWDDFKAGFQEGMEDAKWN